jgi:hypothetical protein
MMNQEINDITPDKEVDRQLHSYFMLRSSPALYLKTRVHKQLHLAAQKTDINLAWMAIFASALLSAALIIILRITLGFGVLLIGYTVFSLAALVSSIVLLAVCQSAYSDIFV